MSETAEEFNPAERLIRIQGGAYLQVKDRIIWLRKDAPESEIHVDNVVLTDTLAVFKARAMKIVDGQLVGVGEGHGSESPSDFPDYIEKAETKAIGRALGALGYGTAGAFEEDPSRIADAPVRKPEARVARGATGQVPVDQTRQQQPQASATALISERQLPTIWAMAGDRGWTDEDVHGYTAEVCGKASLNDLTRKEASTFIDYLKSIPTLKTGLRQEPQKGNPQGLPGLPDEPAHIRDAPSFHFADGG